MFDLWKKTNRQFSAETNYNFYIDVQKIRQVMMCSMYKYQCNCEEGITVLLIFYIFPSENVMNFAVQLLNFEIFKGIELPNSNLFRL